MSEMIVVESARHRGRWVAAGLAVVAAAALLAGWRAGVFTAPDSPGTGERGAPATQPVVREDIAATTGVAEVTAQRIVERFRAYRAHVKATAPDATRTRERQYIADLTSRLRREHDAYEHISQSWSRDAAEQKKELRRVRAQTLLDIQVELARLGEVDRLSQIERLPFEAKLTELETFLEDARDKYVAQP